mgnify:CR=1 FL=1
MGVTVSGSTTYYGRDDSGTANNNALNPDGGSGAVTAFTFTGDLTLNFGSGGGVDPNTQIVIGGTAYNFTVEIVGTMLADYPGEDNTGARVHSSYLSEPVVIISYIDGSGVEQRIFFFPDPNIQSAANIGNIRNGSIGLEPAYQIDCLCAGTGLLTPNGYRPVESIQVGDFLLNDRGEAKQVIWTGSTVISVGQLTHDIDRRPIKIAANTFGHGCPAVDLFVSPQHRIVIEGAAPTLLFGEDRVLVPAKFLVGTLAERVMPTEPVHYHHILLEDHELVLSDGLVSESFQPARRTLDVMSEENQQRLVAAIQALGTEQMLTRRDALLSLKQPEGIALAEMVQRLSPASLPVAAAEQRLS